MRVALSPCGAAGTGKESFYKDIKSGVHIQYTRSRQGINALRDDQTFIAPQPDEIPSAELPSRVHASRACFEIRFCKGAGDHWPVVAKWR